MDKEILFDYVKNVIFQKLEEQKTELFSSKNLTRDDIKSLVFSEDDKVERFLNENNLTFDERQMQELRDMQHDIISDLEWTFKKWKN